MFAEISFLKKKEERIKKANKAFQLEFRSNVPTCPKKIKLKSASNVGFFCENKRFLKHLIRASTISKKTAPAS